jgi:hypothetical protein
VKPGRGIEDVRVAAAGPVRTGVVPLASPAGLPENDREEVDVRLLKPAEACASSDTEDDPSRRLCTPLEGAAEPQR